MDLKVRDLGNLTLLLAGVIFAVGTGLWVQAQDLSPQQLLGTSIIYFVVAIALFIAGVLILAKAK